MEEDKDGPVPETHCLQLGGEVVVEEEEGGGVEVGVVEGLEDTPQVPAAVRERETINGVWRCLRGCT